MAKLLCEIGFGETNEGKSDGIANGVWVSNDVVRRYYGDLNRNNRRRQSSNDGVNSNLAISNQLSIVADPYAFENFHNIRYAKFMGTKWNVADIEVQYPRLIMTLGGVYNG